MGSTQSKKEEVIIAQAGNSGGQSTDVQQSKTPTTLEITGILSTLVLVLLLTALIYRCIRKTLRKRINKEVRRIATELSRSQEQV